MAEAEPKGKKIDLTKLNHDQILKLTAARCAVAYCSTPGHRWKSQILLQLYPFDNAKASPAPSDIITKGFDLCSFLDGSNVFTKKLYFCPKEFPPITAEDDSAQKESKLNAIDSYIKTEAKKSGSLLTISESSICSDKKFYRVYVCEHCNPNKIRHKARKNAKSEADGETSQSNAVACFRETHLVNNKKNGRRVGSQKGGKNLKRRTNSAILSENPCPFNFRVRVDSVGFYVTLWGSCGVSYHQGHPKFRRDSLPTQKSSLTQEQFDDVMHVNNATVNNGTCREFMVSKFGTYLSPTQIRYLNNLEGEEFSDEFDNLLHAFHESDQIRFNVLYSTKDTHSEEDVVLTTTKILGEVKSEVPLLESKERASLRPVAESILKERTARGLEEDNVFHCIAWAHEKVLRYFFLCPEVVTFDVTSHTNKNGYHLLTFSCRTSVDKQVVFCRVWLPDQRRASFRYVFQEALLKILPGHVLRRVTFLICDGDAQQNLELRIAVEKLCPNAELGLCSFHLFNNGWNRHVIGSSNWLKSRNTAWTTFVRRIHSWMYSWTRPSYCQTEEEYEISKHLLIVCLTSKYALKMAGNNKQLIASAIAFIKGYVFPNETHFLFHPRKDKRTLCVATTSAHEGTNNGLKSHAAGVKATHTMNNAAKAMTIQDSGKYSELELIVGSDFRHRNKSKWSNLPTASYLLTYAEGLVLHSRERSKLYRVRRIGASLFQVVYTGDGCDDSFVSRYIEDWTPVENGEGGGDDSDDKSNQNKSGEEDDDLIDGAEMYCPLFSRAYTVDLNESCSKCDCCHFERAGYPCEHITACADAVCIARGTSFEGFQHDSVSVRWRIDYMYWGYQNAESDTEKDLVKLFHALASDDVKGPKFHHTIPPSMEIKPAIEPLPAQQRIKNYPKDVLPALLKDYKTNRFDMLLSKTKLPPLSKALEDSLDDNNNIVSGALNDVANGILGELDELHASSDDNFEAILDKLHPQDNDSFHEVAAIQQGRSSRDVFYPLFNELTDLVDQCPLEQAVEAEHRLKEIIADLHKTIKATTARKSTSPTGATALDSADAKVTSPTTEASPSEVSSTELMASVTPTLPMAMPVSTVVSDRKDLSGKKRMWAPITSKQHNGPARVKVAKNSKYSS